MTKITIETETITTELTPSEAAAKIKEALGIAEWPQVDDWYWCVNGNGDDLGCRWYDDEVDRYRLAHGNCSPTQEGLAWYKGVMAKVKAPWAIEQHRDKTFGAFEPEVGIGRMYGVYLGTRWTCRPEFECIGGINVPFATQSDIERSFAECGEHWEVLK